MWWYVYLLQNEITKELYIGKTKDLKRRLEEHRIGRSRFTKEKGKWRLIYVEAYSSEKDATLRERRLKYHGRAKQELLKRIKNCLLA